MFEYLIVVDCPTTLGRFMIILYCYSQCRVGNLEEEHGGTIEGELS
jgi:hypothetical protein